MGQRHGVRLERASRQGLRHRRQGRKTRSQDALLGALSAERPRLQERHALHRGASKISKVEKVEDNLDNPPKPVLIYDDLPKDEPHGWKFLTIGPDNKLYCQVGAPCNICMPSPAHAQIRRINSDGSGAEVLARGIRQIVGMDWNPTTKQLYFTENSRDWLSEDIPEDKLNRVAQPGKDNFGYPYCHQGNIPDQEFGWGHSCDEFTKPIALLGPHTAPLGMRFYTGNMFPAEYRNAIFITRHGSWNRSKKIGGDIVVAKLNKDGTVKSSEPFLTGFIENNNYVGRPADVEILKDGSLLVSDDFNGVVYRSKYPPAKPGALVLEPLQAACPYFRTKNYS